MRVMRTITFTGKEKLKDGVIFKEIETYLSEDLEDVVKVLKFSESKGYHCYAEFNDNIIYSDESEDEAYIKVTGKTKDEFKKFQEESVKKYLNEEKEFQKRKNGVIDEYIKKGHEILDEKYHEEWDRIVPIRVEDLYHGMELDSALKVIEMLKNHASREEIDEALDEYGHSGMSHGLTVAIIRHFSDEGSDFE